MCGPILCRPTAPSPAAAASLNLLGTTLPAHGDPPDVDEFRCLNLNISRPTEALEDLPVAVWIHGYYASFVVMSKFSADG